MIVKNIAQGWIFITLLLHQLFAILSQDVPMARLCVCGEEAMAKCRDLSGAALIQGWKPLLYCVIANDEYECMQKIEQSEADLVNLDSGMVYKAGIYYSMIPIMAEVYWRNSAVSPTYNAVAVIRANDRRINSISDLANKKSCHTGVGDSAGWIIPISALFQQNLIPPYDCNNPVVSAARFFNESCTPNALAKENNLGFNPSSMCNLCRGSGPHYCTSTDVYAGEEGAFACLRDRLGDVAFVRDVTPFVMTKGNDYVSGFSAADFELLCSDGSKRPITEYQTCNWGHVPGNALMTLSSQSKSSIKAYKELFIKIANVYGINPHQNASILESDFKLFQSRPRYSRANLLFSDTAVGLIDVGRRNSYQSYLGEEYLNTIKNMRRCDVDDVVWCVVSPNEMSKCDRMARAFKAKSLSPAVRCTLGRSKTDCMRMIHKKEATMALFEAAEALEAGRRFGLIPLLAENYGLDEPVYYAVAIALKKDLSTNFLNLRGKTTCHGSFGSAAGWYAPLSLLKSLGQIRVLPEDRCWPGKSVGEFFQKSCAPGALSTEYDPRGNRNGVNLCDLCIGTGENYCRRSDSEPFFGDSGALRCLVVGGGVVAFARHTTVRDNVNGKNNQHWARDRVDGDFQLLCKNGDRAEVSDWHKCNLLKIPADVVMIGRDRTTKEKRAYVELMLVAEQSYGGKLSGDYYNPNVFSHYMDFKLFVSNEMTKNVIFNDATIKLTLIPEDKQDYAKYLGQEFISIVDSVACRSGNSPTFYYIIKGPVNILILAFTTFLLHSAIGS